MSDSHLDSNRIRKMASLRRGAIRSRSYCIVAAGACLGAAAELIYELSQKPRLLGILLCVAGSSALLYLAVYFARLALRFHRESKRSALPPVEGEPDFSPLQDGSQFARNLETLHGAEAADRRDEPHESHEP